MDIYCKGGKLTQQGKETLVDDIVRNLYFGRYNQLKTEIMNKFQITEKTFNFIIYIMNYNTFQKKVFLELKNRLLKTDDEEDVLICYKNNTLEALYQDNKEVFKQHMSEVKLEIMNKFN